MKTRPNHILQIFASRSWGGGEQYVFDLSQRLIEDDHHVYFIHRKSAVIEKRLKSIHSFSIILPLLNCFDIWSIIRIAFIIRKYNIELIHTHQFKDTFLALFSKLLCQRNVKVIFTRHLVKKGKTNKLYTYLYKHLNKLIFVSDLAKNEFLSSGPNINLNKTITIPNSIFPVPETTAYTDLRSCYSISEQTVILAFIGRIVKEKGVETLLEALNNLKTLDFVLLIAGKGEKSYERFLKEKIKKDGLEHKIFFLGFIENIHPIVQQIDIGIAPSVWREPFGLSIIEMMQAGKPVITTNNGAQTEYITHKRDGILIPPSDEKVLCEAIRLLITHKEERLIIGQNAQMAFNQKLSYHIFYNKILDVYLNS